MSKFQDGQRLINLKIVVLLGYVWIYAGKKDILGEEEVRMNFRERERE